MQQYLEDSERDLIFQNLRATVENKKCADCPKKNPTWASVYLGLFLCYDCAGKHRNYGVHYSFVRSLELDKWNRRQITFMEIGGNAKAQQYFAKHGLSNPIDYKSTIVTNYKNDQTKKVDSMLASHVDTTQKVEPPILKSQRVEEQSHRGEQSVGKEAVPSVDKVEEKSANSFDNIKIDKTQTKTKGFTVEFTKNKTAATGVKSRIAARKIENLDIAMLTLEEDNPHRNRILSMESLDSVNTCDTMGDRKFSFEGAVRGSESMNDVNDEEKLKKFKNAKAISSSDFKNEGKENVAMDTKRFSGVSGISSTQYFGHDNGHAGSNHVENAKEFLSNVGDKLKEKAGTLGSFLSKVNARWQQTNEEVGIVEMGL